MIERLSGAVAALTGEGVILDVGGVGYFLEASSLTMRDIPSVGERTVLFTHMHVREDALQLFGFSTEEERELFRLLLGVSKIGPKLALAVLSCRRPAELRRGLATGDVALFSSVPGIGRKTAERLILELREKVGEFSSLASTPGVTAEPAYNGSVYLARAALIELGYAPQEAERLLAGADPDQPVETIICQALGRRG